MQRVLSLLSLGQPSIGSMIGNLRAIFSDNIVRSSATKATAVSSQLDSIPNNMPLFTHDAFPYSFARLEQVKRCLKRNLLFVLERGIRL